MFMLIAALSDNPGLLTFRIVAGIIFSVLPIFMVGSFLPKAFRTGIIASTRVAASGGPTGYTYRDKNPVKFWLIFMLYCLSTAFMVYAVICIIRGPVSHH
jgi:hypothetical protein